MRRPIAVGFTLFGLAACGPLEELFENRELDPFCPGPTAQVAGTWTITGSGERSGCANGTFNTSLFRLSSQPLPIVQTEEILELVSDQVPDAFFFSNGTVQGQCVEFRTVEETELGPLEYDWTGQVGSDGTEISGNFTGSGPRECEVRGNFRITIQ